MEAENSNQNITVENFVKQLWISFFSFKDLDLSQLMHYGHVKGWLEDQDERDFSAFIDKRTAARIVHMFTKLELHLPDAEDISGAEVLQDLYTCRVCANHVAQVFVKGFMNSEEFLQDDKVVELFNMNRLLLEKEAIHIIKKIQDFCSI